MTARANIYVLPDAVDEPTNGYAQPLRICFLGPDVEATGRGMDVSDVMVSLLDGDGANAMEAKFIAAVDTEAARIGYTVTKIINPSVPKRLR
jgi:hypothetical protein